MDKSKIAAGIFNKYAKEYQEKFMDTSLYHESFDVFCNAIPVKNASILELACGPGNITRYLLQKRPDFKILATDLSPNMLEQARLNNPRAEFKLMDCRDIRNVRKKFDGIMCGFCLPYLDMDEVNQLLHDAASILNSGGVIYISTMEDDYEKSGFKKGSQGDEIYMHYYTADFLTVALMESGYDIIELQRKVTFDVEGKLTTDLLIIASFINDR